MRNFNGKGQLEFIIEEINSNNNFILTIKERELIETFLVVNDSLQFVTTTIGEVPSSMFLGTSNHKSKIIDQNENIDELNIEAWFESFGDKFTFEKLLQFSKLYDVLNKANTIEFYKKYKKLFLENIEV